MLSRFSRVQLFAILWTVAHQAPLSMGFSRQESWSGVAISSSRGIFPNQESNLHLPVPFALQADFYLLSELCMLSHFSHV